VRIRLADGGDFDAATALLEELGRAVVTAETRPACRTLFEEQVADGDSAHLVAEEGGRVIGFCSLHFRERLNYVRPEAWIPDLIVTASARRRGAARLLLEEAERRARVRGSGQLTLESGYERAEAHLLYAALGMEDAGKQFKKPLR
jgi:GNAT superfamily N-acetyltransferase